MMRRKKIIIILIVSAILILTVIGISAMRKSSNQEQPTNNDSIVLLRINGLDDPQYLFSSDTQSAIVLGIDQYLKADNIKTDGVVGIIRKDSYTQKEVDSATISTLLIDIPAAKRTYKISSSGSGDPEGDNSLYILCPSQDELIYPKFNCKDDTV